MKFVPNPTQPAGRRPVELITDRAKRYRAQKNPPPGPPVCSYCGSTRHVGIDHIDGDEANGAPSNLTWACKSCNTRKGRLFRDLGIGKLTRQFNPGAGAQTLREYRDIAAALTGRPAKMRPKTAFRKLQGTPPQRRARFARILRNPSQVPTLAQYKWAVAAHERGAHDDGGAIIHATPKYLRRQYAREIAETKRQHGTHRRTRTSDDEIPF